MAIEDIREDIQWAAMCEAVGRDIRDEYWPDEGDDIEALRRSLVRHRTAAAAERQCHKARAMLIDIETDEDGSNGRIIVATPTGDRREEREAMLTAVVAFDSVRRGSAQEMTQARIVAFLLPWLLGR
jgi:hypothetical protein